MLLPRKYLSLSLIDFSTPQSDFSGRPVESRIKILDLESRVGSTSSILIARYEQKGSVFALERHNSGHGLYMVCKVGDWVDLQELKKHALALSHERLQPIKVEEAFDRPISTAVTTPHLHKGNKKKQAAIEAIQTLVKKRARSESVALLNELPRLESIIEPGQPITQSPLLPYDAFVPGKEHLDEATQVQSPAPIIGAETLPHEPQQSADAIFDNIRTQYFDALYKSMVRKHRYTLFYHTNDILRDHWHTLQKAHCRGLDLPFTLILRRT
jgi:DNA replication regulator SLD3